MEHRYLVTGTDTGVGKTRVTAALARRAHALGKRVLAWKPIETGVPLTAELGEDQRTLVEAAGGWQESEARGLYRFPLAAAPLPASIAANTPIDLERLRRVLASAEPAADLVLVEGAGGLRVPIVERPNGVVDMAGLATMLGLPLIIVARAGLGTINHSLLTIEAAERDGLAIAALVLSHRPDDDRDFTESNAREIRRRWAGRVTVFEGDGASLLASVSGRTW